MLSKFFIQRPIFACVISILIVILGVVSYFRLPVDQYPDLAPPIVRVATGYPGASAQVIADTVAAAIEQEVNGVEGMIYMSSVSANGTYALDISFAAGTNVDIAAVLVQNRVNVALTRLPDEVRRQGVTTAKQSTAIVGVVAIFANPDAPAQDRAAVDDLFLSNYMSLNVKDEVLRIKGVGGYTIFPGKDYGMRVWLDMDKLRARGLTVSDVNAAIREQNVQVAAGVIGRQPVPEGQVYELAVNTLGRLTEPEQFAKIVLKREPGDRVVRVEDVARVELGSRSYTNYAGYNGRPAAIMPVYQLPGANLVDLARALENKFNDLKKSFPTASDGRPLLAGEFFYDASMFIDASIHEVVKTLFEAFILVFIVVLVFLQNFRTTIIPTITIPVALIGTFTFMAAFGFSVNTLTMFGLVLAIGIVVDDAIVVVENVERNLALGAATAAQATTKAMQEIFAPVIAITLVLMSVFIPMAALPGITGEMYRQFALTIAASTFLSAINALTLSPALCALLLKPHSPHHQPGPLARALGLPARLFNSAFDAFTAAYAFATRWLIRLWPVSLAAFAGVLALTAWSYSRVPTGFVPDEDLGFVVVAAQLPDGASLERSESVVQRVKDVALQIDGVKNAVSLSGFSLLDGQLSNYANLWIVLKPWDDRLKGGRSVNAIMNDLRAGVAPIQDAQFLVFSLPAIRGLGNASGFDMRLLDVGNVGRQQLQDATLGMIIGGNDKARTPAVAYAFSSYRAGVPQVYVDVDRERALKMDVPLASIFETLQTALGQAYVNDFNLYGRTFQVNTQAEARFRMAPEDVRKLQVRTRKGEMVPLASVVNVQDSIGPDRVARYNLYVSSTLNGAPARGASSGDTLAAMEKLAAETLPEGVRFDWTGMSYQEKQVGGQIIVVFGLGILLVYLILAAQYESWTAPLSVVLSIPLVVIGAVFALNLTGLDNNVFTGVGLVLLVGLGAKNAILIVEFARQARATGTPILDSAVQAARTRLRPILMTSFAFILGVLPLVIAEGAGAASRRALGTAVFGGMIGATILGLIFTPVLYVVVTAVAEFVKPPKRTVSTPPAPSPPAMPAH